MAREVDPASYAAAQEELKKLLLDLQSDEVDLDAMTERVRRARALIAWSRERLRATQEAVDELLADTE